MRETELQGRVTQYAEYSVREVPLMMKLGAVKDPMLPRKFAKDFKYEAQVWFS